MQTNNFIFLDKIRMDLQEKKAFFIECQKGSVEDEKLKMLLGNIFDQNAAGYRSIVVNKAEYGQYQTHLEELGYAIEEHYYGDYPQDIDLIIRW